VTSAEYPQQLWRPKGSPEVIEIYFYRIQSFDSFPSGLFSNDEVGSSEFVEC